MDPNPKDLGQLSENDLRMMQVSTMNEDEQSSNLVETEQLTFESKVNNLKSKFIEASFSDLKSEEGKFSSIASKEQLGVLLAALPNEHVDVIDKIVDFQTKSYQDREHLIGDPFVWVSRSLMKELLDKYPDTEVSNIYPEEYFDSHIKANIGATREDSRRAYDTVMDWVGRVRTEVIDAMMALPSVKSSGLDNSEVWSLIFLKRKTQELGESYSNALNNLRNISEELSIDSESMEKIDVLTNEEIARQIDIREKALEAIGLMASGSERVQAQKHRTIGNILQSGIYDPDFIRKEGSSVAFAESEVIYAALVLSPQLSTSEFIDACHATIVDVDNHTPSATDSLKVDFLTNATYNSFAYQVKQGSFSGWGGKKILEVGGTKAIEGIRTLGGEPAGIVDAGHGGYTMNYKAGARESMIDIRNYRKYGEPHTMDLICSSRLFDMGSGIGEIAEPYGGENRDNLGEKEMNLIMNNLLRDGGFMIHYDGGLPESFSNEVGDRRVGHVRSFASIYRYSHSEVDRSPKTLGRKQVIFNNETETWEKA